MTGPEKTFRIGMVQASVFYNKVFKNGKELSMPKVVIQCRYKKDDNEWASTNSFGVNDLPKAILALNKAFEFLTVSKPSEIEVEATVGFP